jgi:hypothetical protein
VPVRRPRIDLLSSRIARYIVESVCRISCGACFMTLL